MDALQSPPPLPPFAVPLRRAPFVVASWFRVYGFLSLPIAAWVGYCAWEVATGPVPRGSSPCGSAGGFIFQWGFVGVLTIIAAGVCLSGFGHFAAGHSYVRERESTLMVLVSGVDGLFWAALAILIGFELGFEWFILFVMLATAHLLALWFYATNWRPTLRRASSQ